MGLDDHQNEDHRQTHLDYPTKDVFHQKSKEKNHNIGLDYHDNQNNQQDHNYIGTYGFK